MKREQRLVCSRSSRVRRWPRWRRSGVAATEGLGSVAVRNYERSATYSAADHAALLGTHSTVRALDRDPRSALLAAVARAIESHGNQLTLPIRTRLCLARRETPA